VKERRLPRRELPEIRRQFSRMIDDDVPAVAIMSALGLKRATFYKWKGLYLSGGLKALEVRPIPGRAPKLTEAQTAQLRRWLVGSDPRQFQFDFALWTRVVVGELIRIRFGVQMTPQGVGKLLRRLGLSPQRPLYRASQQDPEAVRRWRAEEFPAIREQARREGAELYFADEAGVRLDHHAGTTWAPVGQTPVVEAVSAPDRLNMISAITPKGAMSFDVFTGRFNAGVFIEFLKKLMHDASGPVFVVVDNHPSHTSHAVRDYVASQDGRLKLFFLPSYSPELNPDEWVWKNVKHDQVGRAGLLRRSEFFELVTGALARLQRMPETIHAFFKDPSLAYIHAAPCVH
jgi:transposase